MSRLSKLLISCLLGAILLLQYYFLYSAKFDEILYDQTGSWLMFVVIMLTMPLNIWLLLRSVFARYETLLAAAPLLAMCTIIINGPVYGYWAGRHEKACFAKYGATVVGRVTSSFNSKGRRMYYAFSAGGVAYTSYNVANPLQRAVDDTLSIIYNTRCPEMNEAIENCE